MRNKRKLTSAVALILVLILTFGLISTALIMTAHAASSSEIQSQIDALKEEANSISGKKSDLQSQIDEKDGQQADMIYEKSMIDQKMNLTREEIDNTTAQIEQYEQLIAEKEQQLQQAKQNEAQLYEQYKDRLRAMEENGTVTYWSILFKAKSFSDLLDRLDMIQEIAKADQEMMDNLAAASEEIQTAQDDLVASQTAMEEQKELLAQQEAELSQQSADAQVLIDQYASESAELQDVYDQYESMEADVMKKIETAQAEYEAAVTAEEEARRAAEAEKKRQEEEAKRQQESGNSSGGTSGDSGSSGGGSSQSPSTGSGTFICPLAGGYTITSAYGWRIHPIYGYKKFHNGVDMAVASGTPVYATAGGTVTIATYESSCGNYVSLAHSDGYGSAYLHLTSYVVSVGDYVTQGQLVGYVGSTGASTGPHLHFAMYYNGSTVNPMDYIG